jgi:hypothetical protein
MMSICKRSYLQTHAVQLRRTQVVGMLSMLGILLLLANCATTPAATAIPATRTVVVSTAQSAATATVQLLPSPPATSTQTVTPTPPAQPLPGPYRVASDTAFIRQGPGLSFPIAEGGSARATYSSLLDIDTISSGESINANPWWGHLRSGLGFISLTSLVPDSVQLRALPIAQPQPGRYLVVVDIVVIREGPGLGFSIAEGGSASAAYRNELEFDGFIAGDSVNANPWWGHLSSGLGFVSMVGLGPKIGELSPTTIPTIAAPTTVVSLPTLSLPAAPPTAVPTQQPATTVPTQQPATAVSTQQPATAKPTQPKPPTSQPTVVPTTPAPIPTTAVPLPSLIVPPGEPTATLTPTSTPSPTPCSLFNCPPDNSLPDLELAVGGPNDPTFQPCTTPHFKDGKQVPYIDTPEPRLVELGQHRFFYLCDFESAVHSAMVTLSDGSTQAVALLSEVPNLDLTNGNARFVIDWPALPIHPLGEYTLTVQHGEGLSETLVFRVLQPKTQYILPIPMVGSAGSTFQIYYVNFPINTTATIELYREDQVTIDGTHILSHIGRLQVTITTAMPDSEGKGWAVETLTSQPSDPISVYGLSYDADRVFSLIWLR